MRYDSIKIHEMGCFRDVAIDFSAIQGTLVAICGPNGAGKSTLLGMLAALSTRECPTRGSLGDLAHARDSFVEGTIVNGARHTIRHQVDAGSGKGECLVLNAAGQPEIPSTGVRPFEAWAKAHLPPPELLYCSTFSAQGSKGMRGLTAGERKAVILRAMGLERLEKFAADAREWAREARVVEAQALARLTEAKASARDVASVQAEHDAAVVAAKAAQDALVAARHALDDAKLAAADKAVFAKEVRQAQERRAACLKRKSDIEARMADVMARIGNNEKVIAQKAEIEAAVVALGLAKANLAEAEEAARAETAEESRLAAEMRRIAGDLDNRVKFAISNEQRKIDAATAAMASLPIVVAAESQLVDLRAAVALREQEERDAAAAVDAARGVQLVSADARTFALRGGLTDVHKSADHGTAVAIAKATIDADDDAVERSANAPKVLASAVATHNQSKSALDITRETLRRCEQDAAQRSTIAFAETAKAEAEAAMATILAEKASLVAAGEALVDPYNRARAAAAMAATQAQELRATIVALTPIANLAGPLATAQERLTDLRADVATLRADGETVDAELAGIPQYPDALDDFDLSKFEADLAVTEKRHGAATGGVAVCAESLRTAIADEKRVAELAKAHEFACQETSEWARLGEDLGRDGLQALEIDAVGPEMTELTNDLLRTCVGARWSVIIEAKRQDADGKRELDGCEVLVLDTETGRQGPIETLSGGEGVIVGEAVSLALMMLACKRAGGEAPTLVRDESGAALDPQNAPAYIAMLRRAATLVGASKVLFVSHSPDVVALADARIEVANGTAVVRESVQ